MIEHDYTYVVSGLQDAKYRMREAKRAIKSEEEHKALQAAKIRIEERSREVEFSFARDLALAAAQGVPQTILRKEVLRTNDWGIWSYWRDLAEIEPERVSVKNAKEAERRANSPFQWSDDYSTLTIVKNSAGESVEPVLYYMSTNRKIQGKWWPDSSLTPGQSMSEIERAARKTDPVWSKYLSDEIQRAIDAGLIDNPEQKG